MVRWIVLIAMMTASHVGLAVDWNYTVRPGDNLWNLSERHLVDGHRQLEALRAYNKVKNPYRVRPGTILKFPVDWLRIQPASAMLVERQGAVTVALQDGALDDTYPAGSTLTAGTRVITGNDGYAVIQFADESKVEVHADSELALDALSAYGTGGMVDSRLRLTRGRAESVVDPARRTTSRYQISTPAAIAAVRGTSFRVSYNEGTARSEVQKGAVAVSASGTTLEIPEKFGTLAKKGEPPAPPRPLLPAPDLGALTEPVRELAALVDWPDLDGAKHYRVTLYEDETRATLLLDRLVSDSAAEFEAPPDGTYWLRVRGIDSEGLEGLNGAMALNIDARPLPPSLLSPAEGAKRHDALKLQWGDVEGIPSYAMQVARDAEFSQIVTEQATLTKNALEVTPLPPPGTYYWRVASRAANGEVGPFGEARKFRVLAVPDPVGSDAGVSDEALSLSWGRSAHAAKYEYELALDDKFEKVVAKGESVERVLKLETPDPGTYHFRVRAVSNEDVIGPYGPVNRFEVPDTFDRSFNYMFLVPLLMLL